MDLPKRIKEVIVESLNLEIEPDDIGNEDLLFGTHLGLDSVSTLMLVEALEDEFNIEVEDEELTPELFESVSALADYVKEKMSKMPTY